MFNYKNLAQVTLFCYLLSVSKKGDSLPGAMSYVNMVFNYFDDIKADSISEILIRQPHRRIYRRPKRNRSVFRSSNEAAEWGDKRRHRTLHT